MVEWRKRERMRGDKSEKNANNEGLNFASHVFGRQRLPKTLSAFYN